MTQVGASGGRTRATPRAASNSRGGAGFGLLMSVGLSAALGGCSLSPNIGFPGASEPKDNRQKAAAKAAFYQDVDIRTEIRRSGVTISGATCEARSKFFEKDFVTPARLRLPLLGANTPPLTIRCEHPAQGFASAVLRPGAPAPADSMFEEVFGSERPQKGRYLRGYTLQLLKRTAAGGAPPSALDAAVETAPGPKL